MTLRTLIEPDNRKLVRKLVLIGAAAYEQKFPPFIQFLRRPILGRIIPPLIPAKVSGMRALHFAYHDVSRITPDQIKGWGDPMRERGICQSLRKTAVQILPDNLDDLISNYPQIDVPTLLVWGQHDTIVPVKTGHRLKCELQNAELAIVDDCGHIPHEERPEVTMGILDRFLSS